MIPGSTTKLTEHKVDAAITLYPKADHLLLTGTTTEIANIVPAFGGGFSGVLFITKLTAGAVTTTTSGNIGTDITFPANKPVMLIFSKSESKWFVGAVPA